MSPASIKIRTYLFLFQKEADQGGGYPSTLNAYDRRIGINLILSEIGYFRRPEIK